MEQKEHLNQAAWIMFAVGFAAFLFSGGRWNIGITAWIWPFVFLFFSRQTQTRKQFLLLVAALAVGNVIKWLNVLDAGYWLDAAFCLLWSIFWVLPFLADRLLAQKLPGAVLSSLVFPAVFVSLEYLRSLLPVGSIGLMAYTQAGFLPLVQITSVIGSFGLSFLIFWFGSAVVTVLEKRRGRKLAVGVCLWLIAAAIGFGCIRLAAFPTSRENTVRVASVISPYYAKFSDDTYATLSAEESLQCFLSEAQRAADGNAKIACWNEEAFALDDVDEPLLLEAAVKFAKGHDMILIVSYEIADTDESEDGESVNKSVIILQDGSVTEYIKTHLVPVMEIPGYVKGEGKIPTVVTDYGTLSNVICFDDSFIGYLRGTGAVTNEHFKDTDVLFVPSWDWKPVKNTHTDLSEFRAVENGFALVKPTYDGISTAVDYQGRVIKRFDTADTGFDTVQFAEVPITGVTTVYEKIGTGIDLVFCLSGFFTIALGIIILRKKNHQS